MTKKKKPDAKSVIRDIKQKNLEKKKKRISKLHVIK